MSVLIQQTPLSYQKIRTPQHQCKFRGFCGLDAEWPPEVDPVLVAVDVDADTRNQHQDQQN